MIKLEFNLKKEYSLIELAVESLIADKSQGVSRFIFNCRQETTAAWAVMTYQFYGWRMWLEFYA